MEIIRGYIHPVREDIDINGLKTLKSVTLDISVAPYVSAITDESIIDSLGLRCRVSLIDKINGYEAIGFTLEAGVIFSRVGEPREDLKLIKDILDDVHAHAMNYILDHTPKGLLNLSEAGEAQLWEQAAMVMAKLIEYGLYS